MGKDIATQLIGKITSPTPGPDYERAIETAALYWDSVLAGRPDPKAKAAADRALSHLLGCRAEVRGRRLGLKDKIWRVMT